MALNSEMRRLSRHFIEDYDGRMAAVMDMRANAAQHLTECREAHHHMAAEQHNRLADYRSGRASMAANLRQRFRDLGAGRREMDVMRRQRMADYLHQLRGGVSNVVNDLNAARHNMAAEQRERLSAGRQQLASEARGMRERLSNERQQLASEVRGMRERLSNERQQLASEVRGMRDALHADFSEAHNVWINFTSEMEKHKAKKHPAPQKARNMGAAVSPKRSHDDLTTIPGIGAGRMESLHKIGIHTFAQLAQSTPERVRQALSGPAHLVKVESWIEEAKKRVHK